jgi:hypothetical protein
MIRGMKTRIISLSILAILTVCLLNVAVASATTPTTAPNLVGYDTLYIHCDYNSVPVGSTVYFSGFLTNHHTGYGIGGMPGYLTDNGSHISNTNFCTNTDGTWRMGVTFYGTGTHYVSVNCDGISVGVELQVY